MIASMIQSKKVSQQKQVCKKCEMPKRIKNPGKIDRNKDHPRAQVEIVKPIQEDKRKISSSSSFSAKLISTPGDFMNYLFTFIPICGMSGLRGYQWTDQSGKNWLDGEIEWS